MPPFDLTPGQKSLLGFWGTITAAALQRLNTHDLFSALYNARVDAGLDPGSVSLRDLNPLRSMATRWRDAPIALARAADSTPIGPDHTALAPWSRPLAERNANPRFEVRYEFLTDPALPSGEQWVTIPSDAAGMPANIGDLRRMVEQHAAELADAGSCPPTESGQDFVGVGSILVLEL